MEVSSSAHLTLALALSGGAIGQVCAVHLRLPGIVVLLCLGVLLGPDGLHIIAPKSLGSVLSTLVEFAVAVILFEGGMNLRLRRLRSEQKPIRHLVTIGALTTVIGGMLVAHYVLGWDWQMSFLLGTLIIVTGPTVITPLLRRIKVDKKVSTILEAEGVLGDAIGAITAAVALELVVSSAEASHFWIGVFSVIARLAFGFGIGALSGTILGGLLKKKHLIPDGLENILVLSLILALFQGVNSVVHETGIPAVIAAGIILGNTKGIRVQQELLEFKEQLTVMLIGLLFVLLAADVRIAGVYDLGWRGVIAVALLLFVLRPLTVLVSTWGSQLDMKRVAFIAWMGPRGIVAAAVASLFAETLDHHGIEGGAALRSLVFMVIAVSVLQAGFTGGAVATWLGIKQKVSGWVILGANELAIALAQQLSSSRQEVALIDTNSRDCHSAQEAGLRALYGNGLEDRMLLQSGIAYREGALALTPNDEVNILFQRHVKHAVKPKILAGTLQRKTDRVYAETMTKLGSSVLFGQAQDVDTWSIRIRRRIVTPEFVVWHAKEPPKTIEVPHGLAIILTQERNGNIRPYLSGANIRKGDKFSMLLNNERASEARDWFKAEGFSIDTSR